MDTFFHIITLFSLWEYVSVAFVGLLIGAVALPYLLRHPIFGGWFVGILFFLIRVPLEEDSGRPDRVIGAMLLWTVMALAAAWGRRVVFTNFH
jgi:hypothetical protein